MFQNKKIVLAGGTGFIGEHLAQRWADKNNIIVLTRMSGGAESNRYSQAKPIPNVHYEKWHARTEGDWVRHIDGADIIVNLVGKSVNCRYTEENKAEIFRSRLDATNILGQAVLDVANPPKLFITSASATIYPHATDTWRDESFTDFADDFSVQVCKAWEAEINKFAFSSTRTVIMRTAVVLGKEGVMTPFKNLVRLGLGGKQGDGKQMFSWIHIDDVGRVIEWFYENENQRGVFNVSAPHAVSNGDFMRALRRQMNMPFGLPAYEWQLKIGTFIMRTEMELLLKSRWVYPKRLLDNGFKFQYETIEHAFADLV